MPALQGRVRSRVATHRWLRCVLRFRLILVGTMGAESHFEIHGRRVRSELPCECIASTLGEPGSNIGDRAFDSSAEPDSRRKSRKRVWAGAVDQDDVTAVIPAHRRWRKDVRVKILGDSLQCETSHAAAIMAQDIRAPWPAC